MREFDRDWFVSGPMDLEFKRYIMLAKLKRLSGFLQHGLIWPVIEELEFQLDFLYRFKYEKESLDDKMKVAKDIDFVNFQIIYEVPKDPLSESMQVMHDLANEAIIKFEDLYMDARLTWREVESQLKLTWIPEKKSSLADGYVAIIHNRNTIYFYSFKKPAKLGSDWRSFNIDLVKEVPFDPTELTEFHKEVSKTNEKVLFARIDYTTSYPFLDAVMPVAKSVLYSSLMKDFTF
jgi:hypothetical protein